MNRVKLIFAWYDIWIGLFFDTKKKKLYIFPLPCIGIVIDYGAKASKVFGGWSLCRICGNIVINGDNCDRCEKAKKQKSNRDGCSDE